MEQTQQHQFPSEEVTLPSKGLLYPEGSPLRSGFIEMKYMTAREEDILTNQNYITNGTVIDKLLQSLILTPIDYSDLLIGDKNAVLVASRILGYGAEYSFKTTHPKTGQIETVNVDLTNAEDKLIDEDLLKEGKNEFDFTLPTSKKQVTFKLLTQSDEKKIEQELKGLKKINKNSSPELTTRMKHLFLSVEGDYEKKTIREFVDIHLLARDARALREYVRNIQPDIDLDFEVEFEDGHIQEGVTVPINANFFWPDVEL
tara:strand:+ start:132 stop:905 length:774 start_codon:yes stop_codon:yes gene_type:complete